MALLQPQPETYELADDIFLLAEGLTPAAPLSLHDFQMRLPTPQNSLLCVCLIVPGLAWGSLPLVGGL